MEDQEKKEKLQRFYNQNRRMPSYSEIMLLLGYKSKNAVFKLVEKLESSGFLKKDGQGRLLPGFSSEGVPLLGLVEAGVPAPAEVEQLDMINLSEYLVSRIERTFLLEVKGDSMIEAHIAEGDLIIAERAEDARDGDIVVAEVDGEWTLKYLIKEGSRTWLRPANKKYKDIHPEQSLRIAAVVRGVIRKF